MRTASCALLLLSWSPTAFADPDLRTMCVFSGGDWDQYATLLLPGSDAAFASASPPHEHVRVAATLAVDSASRVRLHTALTGPQLSVSGDIDPNQDHVLSLLGGSVRMGQGTLLVPGARFSVAPGMTDGVVLSPDAAMAADVVGEAKVALSCDRVTNFRQAAPDYEAAMRAGGFRGDDELQTLPAGRQLQLYRQPRGEMVGVIQAAETSRVLWVRDDWRGWQEVAYPGRQGTVWHGWTPRRNLEVGPYDGAGEEPISAIEERDDQEVVLRRCARDVSLVARVGGVEAPVGTMHAGTPFRIASEQGDWWSVTFPGGWITPVEGALLLVPADPMACVE